MRTHLIFDTQKLVKNLNSSKSFYEIQKLKNNLKIKKIYKHEKGRHLSIILPYEIRISPEVVGLIVGEGFIGDRIFIFANSNGKSIEYVSDFLKQFKLPIKFYLEISTRGTSKKFINESKKFWNKQMNTKINKIRLRKEFYNITKHGTLHLRVSSSLFSKLLKQIINLSKNKIEKNRELSLGYLKGILAAEGNINIKKKTKCVYMVRISASKKEERDHYKRCLERISINIYCKDMPTVSKQEAKERGWKTTRGRAGAVIISRWENFVKILNLDLLNLNQEKNKKFLEYFVNNKFTKQFLDFGYFLNKEFTMKEAQKRFGLAGRYVNRVLSLYKRGYLSRRRSKRGFYVYKLNKRYKNIYDLI